MSSSFDKADMRAMLEDFPNQVREASKLGQQIRIPDPVSRIIIAGIGASGIAGDLIKELLRYERKPVTICKEHALPAWVKETTLVFIVTHSGDTPETNSAYAEAVRKNAQVVVITAGGRLRFIAREGSAKVIPLPKGIPARLSLIYSFFAILNVLEASDLCKAHMRDAQNLLQTLDRNNYGKKGEQLAIKLKNTIPLIYAGPKMEPAASRWKQMINENAKAHAFVSVLPDAFHHEVTAFEHPTGNFHAVFLKDEKEHRDIQKQFDRLKEHLKSKNVHVTEISLKGTSQLNKLFSAVHLGDWVSYYLALLHEVDPTPIVAL